MSTAAVADLNEARQLKLPRFEGYTVPTARLSFGGALELKLTSQDDVDLVAALKLGAEATITINVDGHDRELVLGGKVVNRGNKFRKLDESDSVVSTHRLVINDVREGDLDDEE